MTIDETATDTGPIVQPKPKTKKRGRPRTAERKSDDRRLIEALAKEVAELRAAQTASIGRQLAADAPPISVADIELSPKQQEQIPPGTIIQVGTDPGTRAPIYRKKPWTRGDLERTYPKVTFIPRWDVPVMVNGLRYDLKAEVEITVPSVVKDEYERCMRIQHPNYARMYPAPSPVDIHNLDVLARQTGKPAWSGLHFMGTGIDPHAREPQEEGAAGSAATQ